MLKRFRYQIAIFLSVVGPGLITANVDNDSGGILTYSQAGAKYGYLPLWTLIPITLLLIVTQEMCSRMGAVTGKGLSDLIREEFGLRTTFFLMIALVLTNFTNVIAEFAGIASSLELFHISRYISVPICAVAVWLLVVRGSYRSVEKVFLVACSLYVTYIISAFLLKPDWKEAAIYSVKPILMFDTGYITMLIAMVGTSIAPWMQFYLQSAVVEKGITPKEYAQSRIEVILGCILTDVVAFFIIVSCATAIWSHGPKDINDAADAAVALKPFGQYAYLLFSAGPLQCLFLCGLHSSDIHSVHGVRGSGIRVGCRQTLQRSARVLLALYAAGRSRRRRDPVAEFSAGEDDFVFTGGERRTVAGGFDLHGDADQQEEFDEGVDQFAALQRGGVGFRGHHDRPDLGAGVDHGKGNDPVRRRDSAAAIKAARRCATRRCRQSSSQSARC